MTYLLAWIPEDERDQIVSELQIDLSPPPNNHAGLRLCVMAQRFQIETYAEKNRSPQRGQDHDDE